VFAWEQRTAVGVSVAVAVARSSVSRGWQHLGALTNLVALYFVGMLLAIFFAFKLKLNTMVNTRPASDRSLL
jgi:hypothetical protein